MTTSTPAQPSQKENRPTRAQRRAKSNDVYDNSRLIGHHKALPYVLSGPAIITVSVLLALPVLFALYGSLFRADFLGAPETFVGTLNYRDLFADPDFRFALSRSAIFVTGCLVLGTSLALLFAFALNRAVKRMRFFRGLSIAPYIVSSAAAAVMFRLIFNKDFGLANQVIGWFGIDGLPWLTTPNLAMLSVIVAQVWTDLPLAILLLLGGLQTIDPTHMDAAKVDGATPWARARFISTPLIAPQLAISTVWLSYGTLTSLGVVLAMTKSGPGRSTHTLPMELYETAFLRLRTNEALAIVIVILLLNGLLTLFYTSVARRYEPG